MCLGEGKQLAGGGWSAVAGGGGGVGRADSIQGERIWSSFQGQKVELGLLLLIHILCLLGSGSIVIEIDGNLHIGGRMVSKTAYQKTCARKCRW